MKSRGYLVYGVFVVAACAALGLLLWQRQNTERADEAQKNQPPQVVRIPPSGSPALPPPGRSMPPGVPPFAGPPGTGPQRGPIPFNADSNARPPFVGGVKTMAVVDLNSAPVSALVTLPGITPEYAKLIVQHRPYKDRPDLETKTGLPHSVVEQLGPPAMIRSVSTEPFPAPKKKQG